MTTLKSFLFIGLILISLSSFAIKDREKSHSAITVVSSEDIIKKGAFNFGLGQQFGVYTGGVKINGDKTGTEFHVRGNAELNYYFIDGLAVGAGVDFSNAKYTNTTVEPEAVEIDNSIGGHINVLYGTRVGGAVNLITRASVGYGSQTTKYSGYYSDSKNSYNYLGVNLTENVPLQIGQNVYITPFAGYGYTHYTGENIKENQNSFLAGFNIEYYMGCGDKFCDCGKNEVARAERYQPGTWLLGSQTYGSINTGGQTQRYEDEGGGEYKQRVNDSQLKGLALYYPVHNLGVGAQLEVYYDRTKVKDQDYRTVSNELYFSPTARYNLPFDNHLNDIYVQGSFEVGYSNYKTIYMDETNKDNAGVVGWEAVLGYNYFIARHFSISPMLGFSTERYKYKNDGEKDSYSGLIAGFGWNFYIN